MNLADLKDFVTSRSVGGFSATEVSEILEKVVEGGVRPEEVELVAQMSSTAQGEAAQAAIAGFLARYQEQASKNPRITLPSNAPSAGGYTHVRVLGTLFGPNGPKPTDVLESKGGGVLNCYLCSAFGAVAESMPDFLQNNMFANPDGTYSVRFHDRDDPTRYVLITVDNRLLVDWREDVTGAHNRNPEELWVSVLQKAYAAYCDAYPLKSGTTTQAGYDPAFTDIKTEGGDTPADFLRVFLGDANTEFKMPNPAQQEVFLQWIAQALENKKPVMFFHPGGWHCMPVTGVYLDEEGNTMVRLYDEYRDKYVEFTREQFFASGSHGDPLVWTTARPVKDLGNPVEGEVATLLPRPENLPQV